MEAVDVHGRFMWHQLLTRDITRARSFYSKLVGWKAKPWPLDPAYTVWSTSDAPTAGLMEMTPEVPAEAPPHWLQYVGTRDVDGTADAAVRAGGSILKPPGDMKGAGRYAVLRDPQGAAFAIIDPENARPEPASNPPPLGTFSWHELVTTDNEAAFAFYSNLFGWDAITRMDMGETGVYLVFGQNGVQKGGMYIKPPTMPAPPHWLPYAHVPSVDDAVEIIKTNGGNVMLAPMEVPGGSRIAVLCDPTGAAFAIHSYPAAAAAPAEQPKPKAAAKAKAKPKRKAKPKPKVKVKAKAKARMKTKAQAKRKVKAKVRRKSPAKKKAGSARRKK